MEIKFEKVNYADNVSKNKILKNLNFTLEDNTITAFIGNNGSGKSTVLELMGILKFPASGQIKMGGYTIGLKNKVKDIAKLSLDVGIIYQNPEKQFFMDTVKDEIEFALKNYKVFDKEKRIGDSLRMVGLKNSVLKRNPFDLSLGEQKKVALALVLAFNPNVILLDEPTMGLDSKAKEHLIKLIRMMKNRYNKTIVIASNDTDMILKLADNVYIIDKGKVVKSGDKYTILSDYDILKKYDINMPKILKFSYLVKANKGIDIGFRDDINDLMKDVYRHVK